MAEQKRGSIALSETYRPREPLDIYSCPLPPQTEYDELHMTDGVSYNYNGQVIPPAALKAFLKRPKLASEGEEADVDSGRLSGMIFISERSDLKMLHIALHYNDDPPKVKVFSFSDVFDTFNGVRMEDSGCCIAGDYLVYVGTKDDSADRCQPWTAVYTINLKTEETICITPTGQADLNPSPSPSGERIAVASYERNDDWNGENEDLRTNIIVTNLEKSFNRKLVVVNGGWPSWGSDNVIFFHRKVGDFWGVFRADISKGFTSDPTRVTPDGVDAKTPVAIDDTRVAVAIIRPISQFSGIRVEAGYHWHIEIFDSTGLQKPIKITQKIRPIADHFNPFVIDGNQKRIGYHRGEHDLPKHRGSIAFFSTHRQPVPLDIFSCPLSPQSKKDELRMTDGLSYNYNGQVIPPPALKAILKRPKLASEGKEADVDSGRLSGMIFVSERNNLETLYIALHFNGYPVPKLKVFSFADVFGTFNGVRMEDSGCIAGDHLVYITTKDDPEDRCQPWTAVYKTHLKTGKTDRITPSGQADLSPSVSPSGKKIAVASFQRQGGWGGEIADLKTDIFVMNVEKPFNRKLVVVNGGWPTWGSDDVIFFHRKVGEYWGVFRADISKGVASDTYRVTPDGVDAITPAAINATKVAVATIRQKSQFGDVRKEAQYRHIEIIDSTGQQKPIQITQKTRPKADHFNPFVIDGAKRIGYHRCKSDLLMIGDDIPRQVHKLESPHPDVGLFRVSGISFPTFSPDGSQLAFVDNEFKAVWLANNKGLRILYKTKGSDNVFSLGWNQNPQKDILYVCMGPSFNADKQLNIYDIPTVSRVHCRRLTKAFNNAFPSTNPEGTKLVFRSTRGGGDKRFKNLYIMEDARCGEFGDGKMTRLTDGPWTDTHCQWSPRGDWIAFSSSRDKPKDVPEIDNILDLACFAVFLVKANDPSVVVRVIGSGSDLAGNVNRPFFSPDGKSIAVTADLAAMSVDPISLPFFSHSARAYGDIFTVDIDSDDINKNFIASWSMISTMNNPETAWNLLSEEVYTPSCPYVYPDGGESWYMTGHLASQKMMLTD